MPASEWELDNGFIQMWNFSWYFLFFFLNSLFQVVDFYLKFLLQLTLFKHIHFREILIKWLRTLWQILLLDQIAIRNNQLNYFSNWIFFYSNHYFENFHFRKTYFRTKQFKVMVNVRTKISIRRKSVLRCTHNSSASAHLTWLEWTGLDEYLHSTTRICLENVLPKILFEMN